MEIPCRLCRITYCLRRVWPDFLRGTPGRQNCDCALTFSPFVAPGSARDELGQEAVGAGWKDLDDGDPVEWIRHGRGIWQRYLGR